MFHVTHNDGLNPGHVKEQERSRQQTFRLEPFVYTVYLFFPSPHPFVFFVSVCCHYCHMLRLPFRTAFSFSVNSVNYSNAFTGFKHCQPFFLHILIHSVHGLYLRTCLSKMYVVFVCLIQFILKVNWNYVQHQLCKHQNKEFIFFSYFFLSLSLFFYISLQ